MQHTAYCANITHYSLRSKTNIEVPGPWPWLEAPVRLKCEPHFLSIAARNARFRLYIRLSNQSSSSSRCSKREGLCAVNERGLDCSWNSLVIHAFFWAAVFFFFFSSSDACLSKYARQLIHSPSCQQQKTTMTRLNNIVPLQITSSSWIMALLHVQPFCGLDLLFLESIYLPSPTANGVNHAPRCRCLTKTLQCTGSLEHGQIDS